MTFLGLKLDRLAIKASVLLLSLSSNESAITTVVQAQITVPRRFTKSGRLNEFYRPGSRPKDHIINTPPSESIKSEDLPQAFYWGDVKGKSYLTKNLNQHIPQYCGSCWAHGAITSLSDRIKIARDAKSPDINLAVQHVLNCGNAGSCNGGDQLKAFEWMHKNGYVAYDTGLPYTACSSDVTDGLCKDRSAESWLCPADNLNIARTCDTFSSYGGKCVGLTKFPNATVSEYGFITGADAMKKEIWTRGPIACGVAADPILDYPGGIFNDESASREVDHVISIAGWGYDEKNGGSQYWIVRNSWGEYWGEMGWFRVKLGRNQLGLESDCAWAVPGSYTEHNFPCGDGGDGCVGFGDRWVPPKTDKDTESESPSESKNKIDMDSPSSNSNTNSVNYI